MLLVNVGLLGLLGLGPWGLLGLLDLWGLLLGPWGLLCGALGPRLWALGPGPWGIWASSGPERYTVQMYPPKMIRSKDAGATQRTESIRDYRKHKMERTKESWKEPKY